MTASWKLTEPRVELASAVPLATPFLVIIDVANICNFKCKFCFQSVPRSDLRDMGFKGTMMAMDLFMETIEQVTAFPDPVKRMYLFAHGESLLNRHLAEMIRYARSRDAARVIQVTTNGSLLSPEMNLSLIQAGLDELRVSLEGLSSERCSEMAGVDVDFDALIRNVEHFYHHRGDCRLYVKLINVAMEDGDEARFSRLFADISDNASIEYVTPYYKGVEYGSLFESHDKSILGAPVRPVLVCPRIFYMLSICPDGNVTMCNVDNLEEHVFGNVRTHSLVELWNGEAFTALRRQHLEGRGREHPLCVTCACLENCTQASDILDDRRLEILERFT